MKFLRVTSQKQGRPPPTLSNPDDAINIYVKLSSKLLELNTGHTGQSPGCPPPSSTNTTIWGRAPSLLPPITLFYVALFSCFFPSYESRINVFSFFSTSCMKWMNDKRSFNSYRPLPHKVLIKTDQVNLPTSLTSPVLTCSSDSVIVYAYVNTQHLANQA